MEIAYNLDQTLLSFACDEQKVGFTVIILIS
jgi:hypothetical protein